MHRGHEVPKPSAIYLPRPRRHVQIIGDLVLTSSGVLLSQSWQFLYIISIAVGHTENGGRSNRNISMDLIIHGSVHQDIIYLTLR